MLHKITVTMCDQNDKQQGQESPSLETDLSPHIRDLRTCVDKLRGYINYINQLGKLAKEVEEKVVVMESKLRETEAFLKAAQPIATASLEFSRLFFEDMMKVSTEAQHVRQQISAVPRNDDLLVPSTSNSKPPSPSRLSHPVASLQEFDDLMCGLGLPSDELIMNVAFHEEFSMLAIATTKGIYGKFWNATGEADMILPFQPVLMRNNNLKETFQVFDIVSMLGNPVLVAICVNGAIYFLPLALTAGSVHEFIETYSGKNLADPELKIKGMTEILLKNEKEKQCWKLMNKPVQWKKGKNESFESLHFEIPEHFTIMFIPSKRKIRTAYLMTEENGRNNVFMPKDVTFSDVDEEGLPYWVCKTNDQLVLMLAQNCRVHSNSSPKITHCFYIQIGQTVQWNEIGSEPIKIKTDSTGNISTVRLILNEEGTSFGYAFWRNKSTTEKNFWKVNFSFPVLFKKAAALAHYFVLVDYLSDSFVGLRYFKLAMEERDGQVEAVRLEVIMKKMFQKDISTFWFFKRPEGDEIELQLYGVVKVHEATNIDANFRLFKLKEVNSEMTKI